MQQEEDCEVRAIVSGIRGMIENWISSTTPSLLFQTQDTFVTQSLRLHHHLVGTPVPPVTSGTPSSPAQERSNGYRIQSTVKPRYHVDRHFEGNNHRSDRDQNTNRSRDYGVREGEDNWDHDQRQANIPLRNNVRPPFVPTPDRNDVRGHHNESRSGPNQRASEAEGSWRRNQRQANTPR